MKGVVDCRRLPTPCSVDQDSDGVGSITTLRCSQDHLESELVTHSESEIPGLFCDSPSLSLSPLALPLYVFFCTVPFAHCLCLSLFLSPLSLSLVHHLCISLSLSLCLCLSLTISLDISQALSVSDTFSNSVSSPGLARPLGHRVTGRQGALGLFSCPPWQGAQLGCCSGIFQLPGSSHQA